MKATRTFQFVFGILFLVGTTMTLSSCVKEEPTVAVVRVIDANGDPVQGASVRYMALLHKLLLLQMLLLWTPL